MNLISEIGSVPQYQNLESPINGRTKILTEESFVELYLKRELTVAQLSELGVGNKILWLSVKVYYPKYAEQIDRIKFIHASAGQMARGSEGYIKAGKSRTVHLDRKRLADMVREGKSEYAIAEEMGVAPQTVHKNLRTYKIKIPCRKLMSMRERDWETLGVLEILSPGLVESAYSYQNDPHTFYKKLYVTFTTLLKFIWFVKDIAQRHSYFRDTNQIPHDHIAWNTNRGEVMLSVAMLDADIPHQRYYQYARELGRNFTADFYLPQGNLIIEVDGDIHKNLTEKDKTRNETIKTLGYNLLVVTAKDVEKKTDEIISEIKSLL